MEITAASTNSIIGVVTKENRFSAFYTNWKFIQVNSEINTKVSKETIKQIGNIIDETKQNLDDENIVY